MSILIKEVIETLARIRNKKKRIRDYLNKYIPKAAWCDEICPGIPKVQAQPMSDLDNDTGEIRVWLMFLKYGKKQILRGEKYLTN